MKSLLSILLLIGSVVCNTWTSGLAQTIISANYQGAFEPAPAKAWTEGWTNFEPQNTVYPAATVNIEAGDITSDTVWDKSNVYNLNGYVYVKAGVTLTIQPGTIIRSYGKTALIIERGAKIYANGTKDEPIVFTALNMGNEIVPGWGGIVICGRAGHNAPSGVNSKVAGDILAFFGGTDDDDSSGVLRYVRIEFGGLIPPVFSFRLNPLSLYSVGSRTVMEYVQISYSGYDAYQFFGGSISCSHLVSFRTTDDDFDIENGYKGAIQYAVAHRDALAADISGSNGIESDNDANGTLMQPFTSPVFANITLIGPKEQTNAPAANHKNGIHVRRNSSLTLRNSIILGYNQAGIYIDGRRTTSNLVAEKILIKNNYLANNALNVQLRDNSDTLNITNTTDLQSLIFKSENKNENGIAIDGGLINPFILNNTVDYRPSFATGLVNNSVPWKDRLILFPNPASEYVFVKISGENSTDAFASLQNSNGNIVAVQKLVNGIARFDVSIFTNGLYIASVNDGSYSLNRKVIINR